MYHISKFCQKDNKFRLILATNGIYDDFLNVLTSKIIQSQYKNSDFLCNAFNGALIDKFKFWCYKETIVYNWLHCAKVVTDCVKEKLVGEVLSSIPDSVSIPIKEIRLAMLYHLIETLKSCYEYLFKQCLAQYFEKPVSNELVYELCFPLLIYGCIEALVSGRKTETCYPSQLSMLGIVIQDIWKNRYLWQPLLSATPIYLMYFRSICYNLKIYDFTKCNLCFDYDGNVIFLKEQYKPKKIEKEFTELDNKLELLWFNTESSSGYCVDNWEPASQKFIFDSSKFETNLPQNDDKNRKDKIGKVKCCFFQNLRFYYNNPLMLLFSKIVLFYIFEK